MQDRSYVAALEFGRAQVRVAEEAREAARAHEERRGHL